MNALRARIVPVFFSEAIQSQFAAPTARSPEEERDLLQCGIVVGRCCSPGSGSSLPDALLSVRAYSAAFGRLQLCPQLEDAPAWREFPIEADEEMALYHSAIVAVAD